MSHFTLTYSPIRRVCCHADCTLSRYMPGAMLCSVNRSLRLSSPHVLPHPPTSYVLRAWWTSSTGTETTSSCPPDSKQPPPAGGTRPRALVACIVAGFGLRPGDVHFSQHHRHLPYLTSRSPAMVRVGRKGFIPTSQNFPCPASHPSTCYASALAFLASQTCMSPSTSFLIDRILSCVSFYFANLYLLLD